MAARAKALEKKAKLQADKDARLAAEAEKEEAKKWEVGAKDNSKQKAAAEKEMAKLKKKQEVAELIAQDEASTPSKTAKKTKKTGKDDFDFLKAALNAQPKSKAQKEKEAREKKAAEKKKKDEEARALKEARQEAEQAQLKRIASRGIIVDHGEDMMQPVNNRPVELETDDDVFVHDVRGIDDALGVFSFADKATPVPQAGGSSRKAQYARFCDNLLPQLKEEYPGLKLSQYQERMFDAWKKSPENPDNQVGIQRASSGSSRSPVPTGRT